MKENTYQPKMSDRMEAVFDTVYLLFDLIAGILFFAFSNGRPLFVLYGILTLTLCGGEFPDMAYSRITPRPVTAKTPLRRTDNFLFPSSVHQLFWGSRQMPIRITAEIQTIAPTKAGTLRPGKVYCQIYIRMM